MRPGRRPLAAATVGTAAGAAVLLTSTPAAAHGVGGRADLPIEPWLFAYAAGAALAVSFVLLGMLWHSPRLERASAGRALPAGVGRAADATSVVLRAFGSAIFALVVAAALFGSANSASNPAPVWFYVMFWVGVPVASFVLGDVWRALSPFDTLAAAGRLLRGRGPRPTPEAPPDDVDAGATWTNWPGVAAVGGFLWLELAYHTPDSPRVVGWAIVLYTAGVLAATARWGRAWLRTGEGFTVLFALVAAMAPFERRDGRIRLRPPFAGLATLPRRRGQIGIVLVVLGGTAFDGVARTSFWGDVIGDARGWELTGYNTVGLVWVVAMVTLAWLAACRVAAALSGRDPRDPAETVRYLAALVPIVLAYTVAHYFSLLWFESQNAVAKISDPFAKGWDLFGTIDIRPDYASLSPDLIAFVQVGAIVVGHVAGVVTAHDRAVAELPRRTAVRSQYPFLAVMIAYTVAGLLLLLNA